MGKVMIALGMVWVALEHEIRCQPGLTFTVGGVSVMDLDLVLENGVRLAWNAPL
jgi:hypothetical protein